MEQKVKNEPYFFGRENIKSWHFGLISTILMLLLANLSIRGPNSAMVTLYFILFFPLWVMPTLLLYFEKTRKIGAATGIILGFSLTVLSELYLGLLPYVIGTSAYYEGIKKLAIVPALLAPLGIFLLVASVLHFTMELKSWYVAATGILIQISSGFLLLSIESLLGARTIKYVVDGGILVLLAAIIGFAPAILLYFEKTRKRGAVLSAILGVISLAIIIAVLNVGGAPLTVEHRIYITSLPRNEVVSGVMGIVTGSFLMLAGILHFKEKI